MQKKTILVLGSNPEGTTGLKLQREINELEKAIEQSPNREKFNVKTKVVESEMELLESIVNIKPRIIHFCGHGTEQGLVLGYDHKSGRAKLVSNECLTSLLKNYADRIECVLFNTCDSGNLVDVLKHHINYVIGMRKEVRDDAAITFTEGFYRALGSGDRFEKAIETGKTAILGSTSSSDTQPRKATMVDGEGEPLNAQNTEHLIPFIGVNPNPTPIKEIWLSPEEEQQAVQELLEAIESGFNTVKLFHANEPIVLKDQYIPIQVTLERRYQHTVETTWGYAESEAELKRIYALKGSGEEEIKRQQVDWQEAKRQQSRIVVLADPGMGKSTLLRMEVVTAVQQAYQAIEQGKPLTDITLPLLIRLSTLADEIKNLPVIEAIQKIIQNRHSNLLKDNTKANVAAFLTSFVQTQLLSGKCLLLLDALDEVPDPKCPKLLEKLNEFASAYPACAIISTSRIVGYGGRLVDGAKEMEIVPFNQKQTEQYIETWFTHASFTNESASARGLIQALRERPQISGLAQNPLLLSLICSLYQRDQLTLPARRSQIYEQAVNCMLKEWNKTRPEHNDRQTTAKIRLLEALAYHFTTQQQEIFDDEELYDWVESYLESNDAPRDLRDAKTGELIAELSEDDGILQTLARDQHNNQYLFLHRTFQEYFTASYLNRVIKKHEIEGIALIKQYLWNYDWHETITLLASMMQKPMPLIEAIAAEKDDIFQTQLLLAGRCIAECSQLSHPLVEKLIERIWQFWLMYPRLEFIRIVVVAIGQTWVRLVQNLQTALNHEDNDVRWNAAAALGQIGSDKAVDALITALNDEDDYVRWNASEALRQIGSEKAISALITALNHENRDVKRNAAAALGQIGSDNAIDALIAVLNDEDSVIKYDVAEALGQIDSDNVVDALILALNDENVDVRYSAAYALGRIGSNKAVEVLLLALNNEDNFARSDASAALGQISSNIVLDALICTLSDEDSHVRLNAAEALGNIGSDSAVDALIQSLRDEDSGVRRTAAKALGQIGSSRAVDALLLALNDGDSSVRSWAAESLGQIGSIEAVDALICTLNDEEIFGRWGVTQALGQIGSDKAMDALIRTLAHEDSNVRSCAVEALGQIISDSAVDAVIHVLNDEDIGVRRCAAGALGRIGSEKGIDASIAALNDEDRNVRRIAAEALGKIGSIVCLEKLLQSADPYLVKRLDIFPLAKSLAVRFSKAGLPFIPVYPEVIAAVQGGDRISGICNELKG